MPSRSHQAYPSAFEPRLRGVEAQSTANPCHLSAAPPERTPGQARKLMSIPSAEGPSEEPLPGVVGSSPELRALARFVGRVARTNLPAMVLGPTGSGKELVAKALHDLSRRRTGPLVTVNASVLAGDLGASQLFGHTAGAFTGATSVRQGALREASGGTLFIDELGALPLDAQARLLRVLEDGVVQPLGSDRSHQVDVRVITATCEPMSHLIAAGRFRRDLFERLAVCVLKVPSLSERREDIPQIARALLNRSEFHRHRLTSQAVRALRNHTFDGNVRELRNVVLRAAIFAEADVIDAREVTEAIEMFSTGSVPSNDAKVSNPHELWLASNRNASLAARRAGLPRSTFRDLLSRHAAASQTAMNARESDARDDDSHRAPATDDHSVRMLNPSSFLSRP